MKKFAVGDHRAISAAVASLRPHERIAVMTPEDPKYNRPEYMEYEVMRVPGGLIYVYDHSAVFVNESSQ